MGNYRRNINYSVHQKDEKEIELPIIELFTDARKITMQSIPAILLAPTALSVILLSGPQMSVDNICVQKTVIVVKDYFPSANTYVCMYINDIL